MIGQTNKAGTSVAFAPSATKPVFDASTESTSTTALTALARTLVSLDEAEELQRAGSGDEAAFTAIYRRHRAAVFRLAWLITGSESQAADVTQDVFWGCWTPPMHMTWRAGRSPHICAGSRGSEPIG